MKFMFEGHNSTKWSYDATLPSAVQELETHLSSMQTLRRPVLNKLNLWCPWSFQSQIKERDRKIKILKNLTKFLSDAFIHGNLPSTHFLK